MNRFFSMASAAAVCLTLAGASQPGHAKDAPAVYTPESTTVVVLPVINMSNEKDATQRALQANKGSEELRRVFAARGFKVIDDAAVTRVLADAKIDLSDEDQQKKSTLYQVGHALNADLAAFAVVEQVDQHWQTGVFDTRRVGAALVKIWLVDCRTEAPIFNGLSKESKSNGGFLQLGFSGASGQIVNAVAISIRDQLKSFFKPYPELKGDNRDKSQEKKEPVVPAAPQEVSPPPAPVAPAIIAPVQAPDTNPAPTPAPIPPVAPQNPAPPVEVRSDPAVAAVDGDTVTLNIGAAEGLQVDDRVGVQVPREILDPTTHAVLETRIQQVILKVTAAGKLADCVAVNAKFAPQIASIKPGMKIKWWHIPASPSQKK